MKASERDPGTLRLLEDFFGADGDGVVHVEARSASGDLVTAEGRHSLRVFGLANSARRWMLAAAGGAMMATSSAHASTDAFTAAIENQAKGRIVASFAPGVASDLAGDVHAAARAGMGRGYKLSVDTRPFDRFSGPAAVVDIGNDRSVTCQVSLDRIKDLAELFASWRPVGQPAGAAQGRMREFIVHHELTHCDYGAEILRAGSAAPDAQSPGIGSTGFTFKDLVRLQEELRAQSIRNLGSGVFSAALVELRANELNADTRAALNMAAQTIGTAVTDEQVMLAREEFASHIDGVIRTRVELGQPTHNSSELLQVVKGYILDKSLTPAGLRELQQGPLAPANMSGQALHWAIGYASHTSESVVRKAAEQLLASPPDALPQEVQQILVANRQRIQAALESNKPVLMDMRALSGTSVQMVRVMEEGFLRLRQQAEGRTDVQAHMKGDRTSAPGVSVIENEQDFLCSKHQMASFKNRIRDAAEAASQEVCVPERQRGG